MKKIGLVVGVRNRKENLFRQLNSLKNQTFSKKDFEIVVVDYGGSDNLKKDLSKIRELNIKYVFVNTDLKWNEARAKNIGIQSSNAEFIICTNADIVFSKSFLKKIYDELKKHPRNVLFHVVRWDIDEEGKKILGIPTANGDFQATYRENWSDLRGYDESMEGWGGVDPDLKKRAIRKGLRIIDLPPHEIKIYHNFHPTKFNEKEAIENYWKTQLNRFFKVNKKCWGDEKNTPDREIGKIFLAKLFFYPHYSYRKVKYSLSKKLNKGNKKQ